ncbi:2422_t:CDS:2, partial [Funneliformis geosporum]
MEFLEFLDRYLKHFPEATPEQVNKAFQISKSNEFDKKQKLNPLFESIYNIVKSQKDQLLEMQQDQQKNNVIEHNEELAVIEKKILYVRKSYKNLYDQLKKKSGCGLKKFLITGTSGIGKSCFLVYVLMQLLCEDVVVIFQPLDACGTYNDFEFLLNLTTTWYLADGKTSPELVYETTVVSLSLNGIAKKDFQEFDKRHPIQYYMDP